MRNIRQLDSLRGIAVILVIISHWVSKTNIVNRIPIGGIGVDIFFVLSGFLITKILFEARNREISAGHIIRNFYMRRTLRIFPIYYITIFLIFAFHEYTDSHIRDNFIYFLTYTSNFYFFNKGEWDGMVSHLWSLAVEEQFYLFWPFVVLFTRKRYLPYVIAFFITIGITSQIIMRDNSMMDVLTWCCFDAFGMGALLAWMWTYRREDLARHYNYISAAAVVAFLLFCAGIPDGSWKYVPFRTLISIMALWAIAYIVINESRRKLKFGFLLNMRPLIFIGKISYGLYLFHTCVPDITDFLLRPYFNGLVVRKVPLKPFYLGVNTIILVSMAIFSYYMIERRFLNLKKYFAYDEPKPELLEVEAVTAEVLVPAKNKAGI